MKYQPKIDATLKDGPQHPRVFRMITRGNKQAKFVTLSKYSSYGKPE
jgi:hypothetical protein